MAKPRKPAIVLQEMFEVWWEQEGRTILEANIDDDNCETKGMASAFLAGALAQRKIDTQRRRRPLP
jgi:hypothetical protein